MNVRHEKAKGRARISRAATRTALVVLVACDRCGPLPNVRSDTDAMDHVLARNGHAVTVSTLVTAIYRHPTRIDPGSGS